jgi:hypothetical protein
MAGFGAEVAFRPAGLPQGAAIRAPQFVLALSGC